jgi:hypothetical protein
MSNNISNWVSGDANKIQVENATQVLKKLKEKKYSKSKRFKLVKVGDHPLTYNEVPMSKKEVEELQKAEEIDECEVLDDGMSESTEVAVVKEEIIEAQLTIKNVDFGLGLGTIEINIHD